VAVDRRPPTSGRLAGTVAVVVGGGATGPDPERPGTGEASARLLAASGATVAVVGRSAEHSEPTVERILAAGGEAAAFLGDARRAEHCGRIVAEVGSRFGRIDILVNNLGVAIGGSVADVDDATWDEVIAVNLRAPIAMSRAAVPWLRRAGGSIVHVGSVAGIQASGSTPYGTTKAAVIGLTREMAASLGADGIRVNCVLPGHLDTPMADRAGGAPPELRRRLSMLDTVGTGWDVGWAVVFLSSAEARFITAITLPVDGGVTAQLTLAAFNRLGPDHETTDSRR
jgi:NAD(P)-dependent dehydrogenase (short-subunit alcohol dehydrogenase family)